MVTEFICITSQDGGREWKSEKIYYNGNHVGFDVNDWRFCEVPGKRKQLIISNVLKEFPR